jgi:protein-disulfide isomerase
MYRLPFPLMPSGKRARQQRQAAAATAPPPVRSKGVGGARARQASPRALAIGGGVVLLIVIAIVLGVVLSGGSGGSGGGIVTSSDMEGLPSTGSQSWAGSLPGAAEANNLFKGIPQSGLTLGNPKAPITMEMFIDVRCPVCQAYEVNDLSTVVKNHIANGKVQLQLKPWAFLGPQSLTGRRGVIAAADQDKGYQYAKVLYDNQGSEADQWLTGREMAIIAASVDGLKLAQWRDDVNSSGSQTTASAVDKLATQKNVSGTPTILVGCTGGTLRDVLTPAEVALNHAPTLQDTERAINAANCH